MQQEAILKNLSDRFNELSMANPATKMVKGAPVAVHHPHEFLVEKFPTFTDFHEYFAELEPYYKGADSFALVLNNIYEDMRNIPVIINSLDQGNPPSKVGGILKSMQLLNLMAQKKFSLSNTRLAQEYVN